MSGVFRWVIALWTLIPGAAQAQPDARYEVDRAPQTILTTRGTLTGVARSIDVPVDSSITGLAVFVELDHGLDAALFTPERTPVPGMLAGRRRVYAVTTPQPGVWRLDLSNDGTSDSPTFSVTARGDSPIALGDFAFVEKRGDGVHGGYFPIKGMPLIGAPAIGRALAWHVPAGMMFRTIDESGTTLQTLALSNDDREAKPDFLLGTVPLPAVPFWIVMNAKDASGAPIQRQYPTMFRAQTVKVSFYFDGPDVIVRGSSRKFALAVTNAGSTTATFTLNVTTSLGEVRGLSPRTSPIEPGATATRTFSVAIPASASAGDPIELGIVATNTMDATSTNSTSVRLEVARDGDADGDYIDDARDNCPGFPNADQIDMDRDGIGDPCDATPESPVSVVDFKPKNGPAGTRVKISGKAFGATPAENTVSIGGVSAAIVSASTTELVVIVPSGASTAPIAVESPRGWSGSALPFVVESPSAPAAKARKPH